MIKVVQGLEAGLDTMFRLRAEVYAHRWRWTVQVDGRGWETDVCDDERTVYLLHEKGGVLLSSCRMRRTTDPHMGDTAFASIFRTRVCEPDVWEISRSVVAPGILNAGREAAAHEALILMTGVGRWCEREKARATVAQLGDRDLAFYRANNVVFDILETAEIEGQPIHYIRRGIDPADLESRRRRRGAEISEEFRLV